MREITDEEAKKAERRARRLLRSHLTKRQRAQLKKHGGFIVRGGASGRRYCIGGHRDHGERRHILTEGSRNVIDERGWAYGFALRRDDSSSWFRTAVWLTPIFAWRPPSGHMLAQKLAIEHYERAVLRMACRTPASLALSAAVASARGLGFKIGSVRW